MLLIALVIPAVKDLKLPASKCGLKIFNNYNWPLDDREELPWKKNVCIGVWFLWHCSQQYTHSPSEILPSLVPLPKSPGISKIRAGNPKWIAHLHL